jgi:AraC-like DNA-binding protein
MIGWHPSGQSMKVPAPLISGRPEASRARVVELPRLRWAALCDDRLFPGDYGVPVHAHDEPELVFCTKGRITIEVGGMSVEGLPGDLYVLPARVPHAVKSNGPWENICVLYAGGDSILDTVPRTINLRGHPEVRRWLADLCDFHDSYPARPGPVADSLLLAVLNCAAEAEHHHHFTGELHPRLAAAVAWLRDRPDCDVLPADLSAATGTSYSHLSALFRARFGRGPMEFHRGVRMERAQSLLLDPYVSVGEVASRLGYEDVNYFVRLFRKTFGVSPNRWRRGYAAAH